MNISKINQLKQLYKSHLAVGSGVDDIVSSSVETRLNKYGLYEPEIINKAIPEKELDQVLSASLNSKYSQSESEIAKKLFGSMKRAKYDDVVGYYLDLFAGYVQEDAYRKNGSSGGLATWLAVELLKSGKIDGFIHVVKSSKPGVLFEYGISRTMSDIRKGAKSRYYPAELSKALKEVKQKPGNYAIIGVPEVLTEVRLLADVDEVIKCRVKFYIGLVCGHQKSTKYAEAIAWELGVQPGDLIDIDFREKQRTGRAIEYNMRISGLVDGVRKDISIGQASSFVSNWGHGFFKAKFSDFTDNVFNEVADIVVGDAWLEEYVNDPKGTNILIVRNEEILRMLLSAVTGKRLNLDSLTAEDIRRSQEGLIHHLRDELPYRLYKEGVKRNYVPKKRVNSHNKFTRKRKRIQSTRQIISRNSHRIYRKAVKKNSFSYFKKNMKSRMGLYEKLYAHKVRKTVNTPALEAALVKVAGRIVNLPKIIKDSRADGAIISLTGYSNYGNVIQRYALQKFLKENGYNFVSIADDFHHPRANYVIPKKVLVKTVPRFIKRAIKGITPYWYLPSISELYPEVARFNNLIRFANKNIWHKPFNLVDSLNYKNYIVGSDQVWRNWYGDDKNEEKRKAGHYFLDFLGDRETNRLAYAASFGKDVMTDVLSEDFIRYVKPYAKKFNGISVRERSAKSMIREAWTIRDAVEVVDPTLLLDAADYSSLISKKYLVGVPDEKLFYYILDMTLDKRRLLGLVEKKLSQEFWGINPGVEDELPPVEWWLKGFRDSDFVVTDSFHGTVFSILNHTPFVVIGNEGRGLSRITDLLEGLGLEGRIVLEHKISDFSFETLGEINWPKVEKCLSKKREDSSSWLLNHLVR